MLLQLAALLLRDNIIMATGDTLCVFSPHDIEPHAEYGANVVPARLENRNGRQVIVYPNSGWASCYFSDIMPQNYSNRVGATVYIHYAMATATSGDVEWSVGFQRIGDGVADLDLGGVTTVGSVDQDVPSTAGFVSVAGNEYSAGTFFSNIEAGEGFRMRVARISTIDTATGDAHLLWVEIRET